MKKFVAGVLCGALLMVGASVSASKINPVIGQKVDGVMRVIIDGKTVEKDAAIINGVSYLPVRDTTNAINGEIVSVENKVIEISTKGGANVTEDLAEKAKLEDEKYARIAAVENQISKLKSDVLKAQERINITQDQIANGQDLLIAGGDPIPFKESDVYQRFQADIAKEQAEIDRLQGEIAELETELEVLVKGE
ncbi:hypothetical protein [Paenibacillus sp. 598K]|uniref:hypothetical protein n=1 Tax=Paenibacillus sp. 598K TaxID=1117987 RepID=UPI000FFA6A7D|nr:hypothetical protein [Paenibacillus sp. 598K]GBF78262.1 hypothetical protein [Paenibacillus sp. 598K]